MDFDQSYRTNNDLAFALVLLVVLAALGAGLLALTRRHRANLGSQIKLFLVTLSVRFAASVAIYVFGLVRVLGDEDGSGWTGGVELLWRWTQLKVGLLDLPSELLVVFQQQNQGYYYLLGSLFYLTDAPARMPAATLSCFFGALTAVFVYRIAASLFSEWVAVRAAWATCFFPSLIVWSAQTVKEPAVILLETVALYACVHLRLSGFSLRYVLLCAASIVLLYPFRFYAAILAAATAVLALSFPQLGKKPVTLASGLAVAALVIPLAVFSGVLARSQAKIEEFDANRVQRFKYDIAAGSGSGVTVKHDVRTQSGLVLGTLDGAAHLLLAPFPWELGGASLRMLLTLPEAMVWWLLFFAGVVPGLWLAVRRRFGEVLPMLIFIVGLGLLYSMMFGNIGLIVRQRTQLLPWLLIFAMVGLEQRKLRRALKRQSDARIAALVGAPI